MPRQRARKGSPITGWLVIDKPLHMGSTDAVTAIKRALRPQKVGHAGTLDPLATGVLPIALGEATKTIPYLVDGHKSYCFTVTWGSATETDDLEGAVVATSAVRPTSAEITAALPAFQGEIMQAPPAYSAIKVAGKRSYDLARAGEIVELPERPVRCDQLTLLEATESDATLEVHCGKGFYVRSLGRDLALALGTVGHISMLRRLHVGPFDLSAAISPIPVENQSQDDHNSRLLQSLLPLDAALDDIPAVRVDEDEATALTQGRPLNRAEALSLPAEDGQLFLAEFDGRTIAIVQPRTGQLWPIRVFNLPVPPAPADS